MMDQSSSSHFHVAVRLVMAFGSEDVGAGRVIDDEVGSGKLGGGDAGSR